MATKRKTKSRRRTRRRVSGDPSLAPSVISGTRRRKKHTKVGVVRKHRRRVKGMGKITGSDSGDMLLGAIAGVGVGIGLNILAKKFSDKIPGGSKTVAIVKIAGGAVMAIKSKKKMLQGVGMGLAASGAMDAAKEFGIVSGMEEFIHGVGAGQKDEMLIEMNGVDINSTRLISGSDMNQPSVVSGDGDMNGDDMNGTDDGMNGAGSSIMPSVVG